MDTGTALSFRQITSFIDGCQLTSPYDVFTAKGMISRSSLSSLDNVNSFGDGSILYVNRPQSIDVESGQLCGIAVTVSEDISSLYSYVVL